MALCVQKEDMRLLVVPQSSIEQYRRQGEDKALPSELKVRLKHLRGTWQHLRVASEGIIADTRYCYALDAFLLVSCRSLDW